MENSISTSIIKHLKEELSNLALLTLGQHLWSLRMDSESIACLCKLCDTARKSYQEATGIWPSRDLEHKSMEKWGNGI